MGKQIESMGIQVTKMNMNFEEIKTFMLFWQNKEITPLKHHVESGSIVVENSPTLQIGETHIPH